MSGNAALEEVTAESQSPRPYGLAVAEVPKEIYVIQITRFNHESYESEVVERSTYHEYYLTKHAAEKKVKYFESLGQKNTETRYFVQTLWPGTELPSIVV